MCLPFHLTNELNNIVLAKLVTHSCFKFNENRYKSGRWHELGEKMCENRKSVAAHAQRKKVGIYLDQLSKICCESDYNRERANEIWGGGSA